MTATELRIVVCCTGVGICNRGIESFCRELYDGLSAHSSLDVYLIKGRGENRDHELIARCIPRTSKCAEMLGICLRRNAYVAEQLSSVFSIIAKLRRLRPDMLITSDSSLMFLLYRWRDLAGLSNLKIVFSNGGPCHPPFVRTDFVHQVAPLYYQEAIDYGEHLEKHCLVPYGISVPDSPPFADDVEKTLLRKTLHVPAGRRVVLSVGWISAEHKRMDYTIRELSRIPVDSRPYLIMLGAIDESSLEIVSMAQDLLGEDGFCARSVPYEKVSDFYKISDVFVLSSLQEGFGRVYLEALMHGLPTIGHNHPVIKYVLGDVGTILDLSTPGVLSEYLQKHASSSEANSPEVRSARFKYVKDKFSWERLVPVYEEMFRKFQRSSSLAREGKPRRWHEKREMRGNL